MTDILASWEYDINNGEKVIKRPETYLNNELTYYPTQNKIFLKVCLYPFNTKYVEIFEIFALIDFVRNFIKNHC